ncbi:GntR family transcriptional regulator [Sutcliffiella rhizosphaerae]|uniref:HTH gntR-type domain-containing protein n=1 Tax=Sutcliffiella rhizosphaerae TaxID=2880967 RepID=A0ABN8A6A7_9BACI|nr:GntR family transcriptional regulator [Sutcliffiella rhizosphaerae]CAG9620595.1 hypothetical protein BACCIP111883_01364 [Sutcliffiella rhizosphaerae]
MTTQYDTNKPIYLQIIENISKKIVRGELITGEKLPSVRDMAIKSSVNPNTIQRTYSELERMGIVETKRGQGTFITENKGMIRQLKEELENKVVEGFVQNMKDIGANEKEIVESVVKYLDLVKGGGNH